MIVNEPKLFPDVLRDMAEGFLDKFFGVLDREPPMVSTSEDSSRGFMSSLIMTRDRRTIVSLFEATSKRHCELNLLANQRTRKSDREM